MLSLICQETDKIFFVSVFISGIVSENNVFSLSVVSKQLNSQVGLLTVVLRKDPSSIIEDIKISYAIISSSNIPFQTAFGPNILTNYDYFFSGVSDVVPLSQGIRVVE